MDTEKSQDYLVTGMVFLSLKIVFTELQSTTYAIVKTFRF